MVNYFKENDIKWHFIHKRFRTPFFTYAIWDGSTKHYDNEIKFPYEVDNYIYLDTSIAITENDWCAMEDKVLKEIANNHRFLIDVIKRAYDVNDEIEAWIAKINSIDVNELTRNDLLNNWQYYVNKTNQFGAVVMLPLYYEKTLTAHLKKCISEYFPIRAHTIMLQLFTTPMKSGVAQLQELDVIKLAIRKCENKLTKYDKEKFLYNYSWTKNTSLDGEYMTEAELDIQIDIMSASNPSDKLKKYTTKHNNMTNAFNQKKSKLSPDLKLLIDTIQESIYYRGWRTERYYRNAYYLQKFYTKTAKVIGLHEKLDLFYLTFPEILGALQSSRFIDQKVITERKGGYAVIATREYTKIYSGKDLCVLKNNIKFAQVENTKLIKGQTSYRGQVKGRVCMVLSKSDLTKINYGDILVTNSTTIDYISYLNKVTAIVTDEGGILSHASVVSRELHIPCIIGTKNATQVFKDGDMVEVDANKGIVRKI
jgi:phosphohistidine swiveling domain-containing protein